MNRTFKHQFIDRWKRFFSGADLPIVFSYTDEEVPEEQQEPGEGFHCLICDLAQVRQGASRRFNAETIQCRGGRRYMGFETELGPNFAYFLSCGVPGEMEGERYKRSPELVEQYLENQPPFEAPGHSIVFKRWDKLDEEDSPEVVIFFATPDVLSGLFTLANFNAVDPQAVISPFGSGCASIVHHPYMELRSEHPRAILGMFDVSARPCVPPDVLSFAVPWPKFADMVEQMEESFLITKSWQKVRSRL